MAEQAKNILKTARAILTRLFKITLLLSPISYIIFALLVSNWFPFASDEESIRHIFEWLVILATSISIIFLLSWLPLKKNLWPFFTLFVGIAFLTFFGIGYFSSIQHPIGTLTFLSGFYAIGCALLGVSAVAFFRWVLQPRHFKKYLFGCACLATLIALFYAEEDWRGKYDWNHFRQEWEAKGEKFDFRDFVPSPVPDDQNFAFAPVVASSYAMMLDKSGHEIIPRNTNIVSQLQLDLVDYHHQGESVSYGFGSDGPTNRGNWLIAQKTDLREWQNYYRWLAAKTNEFTVSPQPQTPAQDVLLALSKFDPVVEDLRAAAKLPASRFPLEYDKDNPAAILLPHLAAMKRSSQFLQLRAIAEVQNGEIEKAFDDVKLSLRLAEAIRTEPFIITHLVRIAILQITLQPVWEGLAEHQWSDAQLAELDSELVRLNFLEDYENSVRGERAAHVKIIDWLEQNRSRYWQFLAMLENDAHRQDDVVKNFVTTSAFYLMPKGWFYQNEVVLAQLEQQWSLSGVDDATQTISPKKTAQADEAVKSISHARPFNLFACVLLPALGNFAQKTAYGQNAVNMVRTAIALERYRLAHGEFPETLDALAPQFIAQVPHDVIGGQPLKYRRTSDGQFVLYSVGWNETDDGGVVINKKNGDRWDDSRNKVDISQGDWVWRYPAKEN